MTDFSTLSDDDLNDFLAEKLNLRVDDWAQDLTLAFAALPQGADLSIYQRTDEEVEQEAPEAPQFYALKEEDIPVEKLRFRMRLRIAGYGFDVDQAPTIARGIAQLLAAYLEAVS